MQRIVKLIAKSRGPVATLLVAMLACSLAARPEVSLMLYQSSQERLILATGEARQGLEHIILVAIALAHFAILLRRSSHVHA